ncbi:MAG: TonB-dependent receptor, partial [Gemmatimonadetes bacterium]|nr:TonB-dependent receptor [Gemmatimonadota bacterium]
MSFLLLLSGGAAFAQVTGKVIGTVTDGDTGQPLVGAQIVVEGTNLGNVSNEDGYYFINNIAVGVQSLTAQYLGYQTTTNEQRILAGQTMTVDFRLSSEIIQADQAIVAVIEREPLVARDNTVSKTRFTAGDAQGLPIGSIDQLVTLAAGIYRSGTVQDGNGFVIRGGRASESATFIDGVLITDFGTQSNQTEISTFAIEEVDVITGGFSAEFGHAQSGVVNIVTREGARNFSGNVRYTTDGEWSTDGYGFEEIARAADTAGFPEPQDCCGYNQITASIGGPIVPDRLTAFASVEGTGAANFFPNSAGWNPAQGGFNSDGSTETILPGDRGNDTRAQAKVTAFMPFAKLTGTYLFNREQRENYHDLSGSGVTLGLNQNLSWLATRRRTHDIIIGYDQQIFQTAEKSLNLQVRGNFHQSKLVLGTPLNAQTAQILLDDPDFGAAVCAEFDNVCERALDVVDSFDPDFLNWQWDDVEFFFEDFMTAASIPNIPTVRTSDPDAIFGVPQIFGNTGFGNTFRRRNERRYGIRVDVDSQLNRVHRIKVGGEFNWVNFDVHSVQWTSGQFADEADVDPRIGAIYAQDRLDYGDLVIDLGLRVDHWNPNAMIPLIPGVVPCDISAFDQCDEDAVAVEGVSHTEISPRLGVAHPITDNTQVRLSYGVFHQIPQLRHYFSSVFTDFVAAQQNPNITYGNPNLDFVSTTAFEAGITHLLSDNMVLDIVGYNRDRRGAVRLDVFQTNDISVGVLERRVYLNADNGNVKGLDITVQKRYSDYWSTNLAWSLQWARGTTSSPTEFATGGGLGRLFDPLFPGKLLVPPSELQNETFDRLHTINWTWTMRLPEDFKEGTTGGQIFNNVGVFMVYNAHSGEPFTRRSTEGQGEALEDINASRLPWVHQADIRFTKAFAVGAGMDLEFFAGILNFLN